MQHIVVNDEQAKIISESPESIEIRDRSGKHLGYVAHGFTDEDIAIAKQRLASDHPATRRGKCVITSSCSSRNDSESRIQRKNRLKREQIPTSAVWLVVFERLAVDSLSSRAFPASREAYRR